MSRGTFLAPHNDDETLFGAYILMGHHPDVVIVLRCEPWPQRFKESADACALLGGGPLHQWPFLERAPDWGAVEDRIAALVGPVWAPYPESGGHEQHNEIGRLAVKHIPAERLSLYTTYSATARTVGIPVTPLPGWEERKRNALRHYTSQASRIAVHLARGTEEYIA